MKFKTELHCHTKEISPCSNESYEEVVEKYIAHGYTTLVITNHARAWDFEVNIPGNTWEEKVYEYFAVADRAHKAAGGRLNVLCGMEIMFEDDPNDYLLYGVDPEKFCPVPDYYKMGVGKFHEYASENGFVIIQAHPLRTGIVSIPPEMLDGYEILNGSVAVSNNRIAEAWGRQFADQGLILTSGSDSHCREEKKPNAGILTDEPITSNEQLLAVLKSGSYELIRPDEH